MQNNSIYYGQDDYSIYTKQGKERLWNDEQIIFANGVHAFQIIRRKDTTPLVRIYTEDDGCLSSTDIIFDYSWLNSLRRLINVTQAMVDGFDEVFEFKREYESKWESEDNIK